MSNARVTTRPTDEQNRWAGWMTPCYVTVGITIHHTAVGQIRREIMTATALTEARRRQSATRIRERRLLQEWEKALCHFQLGVDRLERRRSHWDVRLARAMRGIDPDMWWRTNRRIETGELWVAHGSQARLAQRVVYVTRPTVLALAARRDADLHNLVNAATAAENQLHEVTRRLLAATTWDRALTVLAVDPVVLSDLSGAGPIPAGTLSALRHGRPGERPARLPPHPRQGSTCGAKTASSANLEVARRAPHRRQAPTLGAGERGDTE